MCVRVCVYVCMYVCAYMEYICCMPTLHRLIVDLLLFLVWTFFHYT